MTGANFPERDAPGISATNLVNSLRSLKVQLLPPLAILRGLVVVRVFVHPFRTHFADRLLI